MIKCPGCGETAENGMSFCMKCGSPLPKESNTQQAAPPASPAAEHAASQRQAVGAQPVVSQRQDAGAQNAVNAQQDAGAQNAVNAQQDAGAHHAISQQQDAGAQINNITQGAQVAQTGYTPQPGGYAREAQNAPPADSARQDVTQSVTVKKKPFYKRPVIMAAVAILIIAIGTLGFLLGTGAVGPGGAGAAGAAGVQPAGDYMMYIKDGQLHIANVKSLAKFEATSDLLAGLGTSFSARDFYGLSRLAQVTKDGAKVFYPDRLATDGSYNLYSRSLADSGKKPGETMRLDTDLRGEYRISEDGKNVFYIKGDANTLYAYGSNEKTKIASDVREFVTDKNGARLYYADMNGVLYYKNKKAAPEKVDSDTKFVGVSPDLSTIYYTKDGTLYRRRLGEIKEKISSGVVSVIRLYDSGELYYVKESESGGKTLNALCYYDGKAESKINADADFREPLAICPSKPVIAYSSGPAGGGETVNYIAVAGAGAAIETAKTFGEPRINYAGTKLYFIDDVNASRGTGDLWAADITDSGISQPSLLYEDVYQYELIKKDGVYYNNELNKEKTASEFFVNGKLIDSDVPVSIGLSAEIAGTGNIVYYTDYSLSKSRGVLKSRESGKSVMIADDVAQYITFNGKTVAYLVVEGSSKIGELYRYDGSKNRKKIDDDVSALWTAPLSRLTGVSTINITNKW